MKKLITIIACAFAAQAQGEDFILRRELREIEDQQDEIIEQNEKIAKQNERLANQLQSDNFQRQLDADRAERQRSVERSIEARRSQSSGAYIVIEKPTPEPKPLPPLVLPSTGLEEYEKAKAALPAGYVIDKPNADGTITATKVH